MFTFAGLWTQVQFTHPWWAVESVQLEDFTAMRSLNTMLSEPSVCLASRRCLWHGGYSLEPHSLQASSLSLSYSLSLFSFEVVSLKVVQASREPCDQARLTVQPSWPSLSSSLHFRPAPPGPSQAFPFCINCSLVWFAETPNKLWHLCSKKSLTCIISFEPVK